MFNKSKFSQTKFGIAATDAVQIYASIITEFGTVVPHIRVKAKLPAVNLGTVTDLVPAWLYLYAHISDVEIEAEAAVIANMTAKIPLGRTPVMQSEMVFLPNRLFIRGQFQPVTVNAVSGMQARLAAKVPISQTVMRTENSIQPKFAVYMPIADVTPSAAFDLLGRLYAKMPMHPRQFTAEYHTSVQCLRTNETEEIVLEGLNLAPGQRLIIDTDTMEISVDDEVRVDCWVTGGSFFQLKEGDNTLTFFDNAASRKLKATILWQDRFL